MELLTKLESAKTTEGTLSALDFEARLESVHDAQGRALEGYQRVVRVDGNQTLDIVSDQYKLVQHKEAVFPVVDGLGREGWRVKASRIEQYGAKAYVELWRPDKTVVAVGEKVAERLLLRNSYDRSTALTFSFGAVVLTCLNGAVVEKGGVSFHAPHIGGIRERLDGMLRRVEKVEAGFVARMIEEYRHLDAPVTDEIGKEIVRRIVGERAAPQVVPYWRAGIGRNGEPTAWNLYNGITQYLTHDFKGSWGNRERRNAEALELIAGFLREGRLPKEDETQN